MYWRRTNRQERIVRTRGGKANVSDVSVIFLPRCAESVSPWAWLDRRSRRRWVDEHIISTKIFLLAKSHRNHLTCPFFCSCCKFLGCWNKNENEAIYSHSVCRFLRYGERFQCTWTKVGICWRREGVRGLEFTMVTSIFFVLGDAVRSVLPHNTSVNFACI